MRCLAEPPNVEGVAEPDRAAAVRVAFATVGEPLPDGALAERVLDPRVGGQER